MTPTDGLVTGQHGNPTMDMMEMTPKLIGTGWSYFASVGELTTAEDKHVEGFQNFLVDGQTEQTTKQTVLFFCDLLVPMFRTRTHVLHVIHVLPTAREPAQRFCVFLRCDMLVCRGWDGGGVIASGVYVIIDFSSVNTLHVKLYTYVLIR